MAHFPNKIRYFSIISSKIVETREQLNMVILLELAECSLHCASYAPNNRNGIPCYMRQKKTILRLQDSPLYWISLIVSLATR